MYLFLFYYYKVLRVCKEILMLDTVLRIKVRKGISTLKPRVASLFIAELINNKEVGFYLDKRPPLFRVSPFLQKQMNELGVGNQVNALMRDWLCYNIAIVPQFSLYILHIKFIDGAVYSTTIADDKHVKIKQLDGIYRDVYILECIRESVFQYIKDKLKNTV